MLRSSSLLLSFLVVILPLLHSARADEEADPAAATRTLYQQRVAEAEKQHAREIRALGDDFMIALEGAETQLQKQGDLDGVLAVRKELERFQKERHVNLQRKTELPASVVKLRQIYVDASRKQEADHASAKAVLAQRYVTYLEGLVRSLTKEGKLDQALAIRAEAARLGAVAASAPPEAGPKPAALQSKGLLLAWHGSRPHQITGKELGLKLVHTGGNKTLSDSLQASGGRSQVTGLDESWTEAIQNHSELSLVVHFQAENLNQNGPARILSCSGGSGERNFTIGQEGNGLVLRLRTTKTGANGLNPQVQLGTIQADTLHRLVVTYRKGELSCYLDGKACTVQQIDGDFSNWKNFPLLLGNEHQDDRPWKGRIHAFAVYAKVLDADEAIRQSR